MNEYQPIIVIGAPRSGTKILRDFVAAHPDIDRVPFDVNYIWRMGNESVPHDEFDAELAREPVRRKIRSKISRFHDRGRYIIEKTVSNCLRVDFVRAVYPQAKFLHLIRDGRDVVESIYRQWNAPPDWRYILQKVRTFPVLDAFAYGANYAMSLLLKLGNRPGRVADVWGPRYQGIHDDLLERGLLHVCAVQWSRCVRMASEGLQRCPAAQVMQVRYEDLVASPREFAGKIAEFVGVSAEPIEQQSHRITPSNVGKGRCALDEGSLQQVLPVMETELRNHGYLQVESARHTVS